MRTATFDELVVADSSPAVPGEIAAIRDPRVRAVGLDVEDPAALLRLLEGAGVVVELLPVRHTMRVARAAVEAGVHMVSSVFLIDWSIQDPEGVRRQQEELAEIDRLARAKGVTILKEFGMDPGLDLIVAAQAVRGLDAVEVLYTYGAGFPEARLAEANPIGYKFTWSVVDTMYSYAIPGRVVRDGRPHEIAGDAMFSKGNWHLLDLPEMGGPLECFVNGDGSALARLFPSIAGTATTLGRFICRRPGHAAFWEKMVRCGFVGSEPVQVRGVEVIPAEFCAALLGGQPQFQYQAGERDVALIRADARGTREGRPAQCIAQLVDYRDLETGHTAMQRTVAFPMSIGAQLILGGVVRERGIVEPTQVPFEPFLQGLRARGLDIDTRVVAWDGGSAPGT